MDKLNLANNLFRQLGGLRMDYRVIKENDLFLLTDEKGDIYENHPNGLGLYTKDTRFLSKLDLKINGQEPILLSSLADQNYLAKIILTNPHMEKDGELILWRESVEIERKRFIYNGVLYEMVKTKNYYPKPVKFELSFHFDVDFKDMFIVRGFQTGKVGKRTRQSLEGNTIRFHYQGADDIHRATSISWDFPATSVTEDGDLYFNLSLSHEEEKVITLMIQPEIGEQVKEVIEPKKALDFLEQSYREWETNTTKVETDHPIFQSMIKRGIDDLRVLLTDLGYGLFPVAGLPWFGVPFGRDSLIAALQMLPFNAEIAKGTLLTMAAYQGTKIDTWRDEQPGKIMHELRFGELANTNQIPFTPYYGTIDATPLFLVLLTEYVKWTGDLELFKKLEANVKRALTWIDEYGDRDGDLFVEYYQEASKGIANQGWKDSGDSVVHRNGDYAKAPIALAEVQGYVYQGKIGIAEIYQNLGNLDLAKQLHSEAEQLKEKFNSSFWMQDQQFYAIALDKEKAQVGTLTSNPGHLLLSGILDEENAKKVSDLLVSPKMFTGYGIRTMGIGEAGYNPMSYHDGSVWPHDNSLIVLGMSRTKQSAAANTVIQGLIKAATHFEYTRLPELFCGYEDTLGHVVEYPVACSPQAWAAGTPLLFVQAILGLFPNSLDQTITLNPVLPEDINRLKVSQLKIGKGELAITIERKNGTLEVSIDKNTTGYNVTQNLK